MLNVGVSYSPTLKLNLTLDYWSFDYTHVIVEQNPQALLNAAALGDSQASAQVIRDPVTGLLSGPIVIVGVAPFILTLFLMLALLVAFPQIALWLPGQAR